MKVLFNPLAEEFQLAADQASEIRIADEGKYYRSNTVEGALQEIGAGTRSVARHINAGWVDAPHDGNTYGRKNGAWTTITAGGGTWGSITGTLSNQTDLQAALDAKQNSLTFPLAANLGGTGIANAAGSTLTLGAAATITGGGTVALGGFTLTVPATGTAALLATANVFTAGQVVDLSANEIGLRVQAAVGQTSDVFVVESSSGVDYLTVNSIGQTLVNVTPATDTSSRGATESYMYIGQGSTNVVRNYYGLYATAQTKTSQIGTVNNLIGVTGEASHFGTNTLGNAYGLKYSVHAKGTGNITNAYGIHIDAATETSTGQISTFHGVYVAAQTVAVGNYAIYTNAGLISLLGSETKASTAGATWKGIELRAATATITGSTNITTATGFNYFDIARPTLSAANALTVTNAATLYIANSPLGGGAGPATITNPYSVWIDAGISRFDGDGTYVFELPADATGNLTVATGRIPVKIGGATKYLRYYDD